MPGRLRTITASASALLQLSNAKPANPTITTPAVLLRQNSDAFIGYVELNNTWISLDCNPGLTWYQSGQYAQCCPATEAHCYAPTACVGGSQLYTYPDISSARTVACTDNYQNAALSICNTIFIFENTQDSNPRTNINCGDSSANWSYYRNIPLATAATSSIPGSTTSASMPTAGISESSSSSKAWVAGAVIGPMFGFVLAGAGIWFFLCRKKKIAQTPQHGGASRVPIDPVQPPMGVGGHTDAKPQSHWGQPTYYDRLGQPDHAQQSYLQQGGSSPASQYGCQSAYDATVNPRAEGDMQNMQGIKYEGIGETVELDGGDRGIAPGAIPVSELSGIGAKRPGEKPPGNHKAQ